MSSTDEILKGDLFIISAPSGAGKTSLVNALVQANKNLKVAVSFTTRAKRPNEQNGVNYHFVDNQKFEALIASDNFLEYAKVYEEYYGSSKTEIEGILNKGLDVILEIDWQGAMQVKKLMPSAKTIFIMPPSLESLLQRLENRDQDNPEVINKRMQSAKQQIAYYVDYEYLVFNDRFEEALEELGVIVRSQKLLTGHQALKFKTWLKKLLS